MLGDRGGVRLAVSPRSRISRDWTIRQREWENTVVAGEIDFSTTSIDAIRDVYTAGK